MNEAADIIVEAGAVVPAELRHGAGCVVGPYAYIAEGCELESDVRVGARATVTPPPAHSPESGCRLLIRSGVRIEPGAVVSGATLVERGAIVRAGSVVTADVPPYAIVSGNPAQVIGYSSPSSAQSAHSTAKEVRAPDAPGELELVGRARAIRFPEVIDLRGTLTHGEIGGLLPFEVKRFFFVSDVPSRSIRGEHAHRTCQQLLIAACGSVRVSLTDGYERCDIVLDSPSVGLYLPPMTWATQYAYARTTALLVLASHEYDAASYIRDYDEFLSLLT